MIAEISASPDIFIPEFPELPYRGLRPFETREWRLFFGRERATQAVIDLLLERGLVVVHGSSGCGKSSLIRAGVLARLEQEHARSGLAWRTCALRPGDEPAHNLACALACLDDTRTDAERIQRIRRLLTRGPKALGALAETVFADPDRRVCLLIDQFEELFRFARETSPEQAGLLARFVVGLLETRPQGLYAIVTMRSEFLGNCAQFPGLAEAVNRTQYLLPPLDRTAMMQVIREPATLYGGDVTWPLAERLIDDAAGAQDTLPLIQHALMRLWQQAIDAGRAPADSADLSQLEEASGFWRPAEAEVWPRLDLDAYERAGDLGGILSEHADSVLASVAPDERRQKLAELVFLALMTLTPRGMPHAARGALRTLSPSAGYLPTSYRQFWRLSAPAMRRSLCLLDLSPSERARPSISVTRHSFASGRSSRSGTRQIGTHCAVETISAT